VPGRDVTVEAAAALAGVKAEQAESLLARLAGANLVERPQPGRFAQHDLLRLYARERCTGEDTDTDRRAASTRLSLWYLGTVDTAARLIYPEKLRLPVPGLPAATALFTDHTQAGAWLDAERSNLVSAVEHGPRPAAWGIADGLRGYFWLRAHTVDWQVTARAAGGTCDACGRSTGGAVTRS
jgi:hypothetical protein